MSYLITILVPVVLGILYVAFFGVVHIPAKIILALIMAFKFHSAVSLVSMSILNFLIWAAIMFAFFFAMGVLPRAGRCMEFAYSYVIVSIASMLVADALLNWLTPEVKVVTIHYLLLFLSCAVPVAFIVYGLGRQTDFSSKILRGFDRVLASAIMGNLISYMGTQIFNYHEGMALFWILWAAFAAVWYVLDIFAFKPFLAMCVDIEKEVEAEEAAASAKKSYEPLPGETPEETAARVKKLIKEEERLQAKMERRAERYESRMQRREERKERRWERYKENTKRWEEDRQRDEYERQEWLRQQEDNNRRTFGEWW